MQAPCTRAGARGIQRHSLQHGGPAEPARGACALLAAAQRIPPGPPCHAAPSHSHSPALIRRMGCPALIVSGNVG